METGARSTKEELVARVKVVQEEIQQIIVKIGEEDRKEGMRILKGYSAKHFNLDIEFYLASVLGVSHAERFYSKLKAFKDQV